MPVIIPFKDEPMDDFDADKFLRKIRGDDIPECLVTFDKNYKMTDFSRMIKTMLISLEILAERLNKVGTGDSRP